MDILPAMTCLPPNHSTESVAAFMHSVMSGDMKIMSSHADIPVFFSSALVFSKRRISCSSRTKDLTTRTLVRFSCTLEFSPSTRFCTAVKRGAAILMKMAMLIARTGTAIASTSDICVPLLISMEMTIISAPISIPGARRAIRRSVLTKFCSWVTSLVSRVTSEPVLKRSMLRKEKLCTLR